MPDYTKLLDGNSLKAIKTYIDTYFSKATNIRNGITVGSLEQIYDGTTFNFVNPNSPLNGTTVNIGIVTGTYAIMLGGKGRVEGKRGFVNGTQVVATGNYAHAEGNNTHAAGVNSHTEGIQTYASGPASHAEGSSTAATETGAHSEGYGTHADGVYTHSEGSTNYALGDNSHAEGGSNIIGVYSGPSPTPGPAPTPETAVHPEGMGSHAEGNNNTITGAYSHAEGQGNTISSNRAHAEGNGNTVSGLYAHAEGNNGVASGDGAHSEGLYGHAIGNYSHAEGAATYANGLYSHAAGQDSTANGIASFASGYHVTANRDYQTVLGKYNLGQADTLLEVGNGTAENARKNAFEVYKDGHAEISLMGSTTNSVVTKGYVDTATSGISTSEHSYRYRHNVRLYLSDKILIRVSYELSKTQTTYAGTSPSSLAYLARALYYAGATSQNNAIPATGMIYIDANTTGIVTGIYSTSYSASASYVYVTYLPIVTSSGSNATIAVNVPAESTKQLSAIGTPTVTAYVKAV